MILIIFPSFIEEDEVEDVDVADHVRLNVEGAVNTFVEQLPHEKQVAFAAKFKSFKDRLLEGLEKKRQSGKTLIDADDIHEILGKKRERKDDEDDKDAKRSNNNNSDDDDERKERKIWRGAEGDKDAQRKKRDYDGDEDGN